MASEPQKTTMLIVDDDPSIRLLLAGFFERRGYQILEAETGEQGLEIIRNELPDVVLLDLYLPNMSGLDVLRRINREGLKVATITISGEADNDAERESLRLGAADFIVKPLNMPYLETSVMAKLINLGLDLPTRSGLT